MNGARWRRGALGALFAALALVALADDAAAQRGVTIRGGGSFGTIRGTSARAERGSSNFDRSSGGRGSSDRRADVIKDPRVAEGFHAKKRVAVSGGSIRAGKSSSKVPVARDAPRRTELPDTKKKIVANRRSLYWAERRWFRRIIVKGDVYFEEVDPGLGAVVCDDLPSKPNRVKSPDGRELFELHGIYYEPVKRGSKDCWVVVAPPTAEDD